MIHPCLYFLLTTLDLINNGDVYRTSVFLGLLCARGSAARFIPLLVSSLWPLLHSAIHGPVGIVLVSDLLDICPPTLPTHYHYYLWLSEWY